MRYEIGKSARLTFVLTDPAGVPVDGTGVLLTVTKPDATTATPTVSHPGTGSYYSDVALDQAGTWLWRWTVDTPDTADEGALLVGAQAYYPPWLPTLDQIAAHVPLRTIELGTVSGAPVGTFTALTMPNSTQVEQYAVEATGTIMGLLGTLDASLYDMASAVAAMWAAAQVELAQPAEQYDSRRYEMLSATYLASLKSLQDRSDEIGLTGASVDGAYSFPDPVTWGDVML